MVHSPQSCQLFAHTGESQARVSIAGFSVRTNRLAAAFVQRPDTRQWACLDPARVGLRLFQSQRSQS
jgi:hypothetical protein